MPIKGEWKPVRLDSNLLASGIEGLIGIEECTEYDLDNIRISKGNKQREINSKPKKRKRLKESTHSLEVSDDFSLSKCGSTCDMQTTSDCEAQNQFPVHLKAWEEYHLPEEILKGLSDLNFTYPTHIQALTLPAAILGRRDILGAAETGSGKTLAFGLPILTGIMELKQKNIPAFQKGVDNFDFEPSSETTLDGIGCVRVIENVELKDDLKQKPLFALILTPTRELAIQIKNHLSAVAKYTGIDVAVVVGGMAIVKQERILSKSPEIVIATPGRLWELIQEGNRHLSQIDKIRYLAIDETDRMLEKGHFQELQNLLERLNLDETQRKQRQNFVFSATLTLIHDLPSHLKYRKIKIREMTSEKKLKQIIDTLGISDPKIVDITEGKGTSGTLTECRINCNIHEKDYYVYYFLKRYPGRTLIFCNSIGCVKRLATLLNLLNCHPFPLHASMQQRQRIKNLERFRDTANSILIATDVAARGLDIPNIEHVLHYQTPRTAESYVHRSGRTARVSNRGITVLLIEPNELPNYIKLCRTLGKSKDLPTFPTDPSFLNGIKQRVNLARELDKLQLQVRKTNSEDGWIQKAAQEMDIIVDDFSKKYDSGEAVKCKKAADIKRKQLALLLAAPILPKGFSGKYPINPEGSVPFLDTLESRENALDAITRTDGTKSKKVKNIPLFKAKKKRDPKYKQKVRTVVKTKGVLLKNKKRHSK